MSHFRKSLLAIVASVVIVAGCTSFMPSKASVAHGILLEAEMDHATETLLALPLSSSERALADAAVTDFKAVVKQLDRHSPNFEAMVAVIEDPKGAGAALLDDVVSAYLMAHLAYTGYLQRTGEEPSAMLVRYDESARVVYDELDRLTKNDDDGVDFRSLQSYLALTLRAVASFS